MKKLALWIIILIVCLGVIIIQIKNSEEILKPKSEESMVSIPTPPVSPLPKPTSIVSPYFAYYQKYTELVDKYGKASLVEINNGDHSGSSYLNGVCVVDLMDFNEDDIKDLFVIYSNGRLTGKNSGDYAIPQAGTYEIEIWTYAEGTMKQLLHEPNVGSFSSFRNDYWDEDNCFATVYENEAGRPVIQLYRESDKSFSYSNLYYAGETMVRDEFSYDGKHFTMNGAIKTEAVWNQNISGYHKIKLSVYLSNPSFLSSGMIEYFGIDYNNTLSQTERVVDSLAIQKPLEFEVVEENYISLYLQELNRLNRISSDIDYYARPFDYGLYDIDQNGTPELIVLTGSSEADFMYNIYTIDNGKLMDCGEISGSHSNLYISDKGGLVNYQAHMDAYSINEIALVTNKVEINKIEEGVDSEHKGYPKLEEFGLGNYDKRLSLFYVTTPYLIYAYNVKE